MATLVETDVEAQVTLRFGADGSIVMEAEYRSRTAGGQIVRRSSQDIAPLVSAARRQGATDLLNDVVAQVKSLWQIP